MTDLKIQSIDGRRRFSSFYRDGLLQDVLPFWLRHGVDSEYGGILCSLDQDGSVVDTDKGIWQQGRFTWLLGELYNEVEQSEVWLSVIRNNLAFLDQFGFDPSDQRMWFHVTRDGQPIRKRRYAYSESFAAIAYGEAAKATGESKYADQAATCFRNFIDHNQKGAGVQPKFTNTRPLKSIGFPMITINTAQQLRDSIDLEESSRLIDQATEEIETDFVKHDMDCVMETVGLDGSVSDHFDGRTLNPGHAIEGAWFVMAEGLHRQDHAMVKLGCEMLDYMWERGWDSTYGGLLYFVGVDGKPVQDYWHDMKFWWPHNEAIIATLLAYLLTGQEKYAMWHSKVHEWAFQHFPDAEHGEWFGYLRRDGSRSSSLKGNLWKGPFHLPRMQLVCWKLLDKALEVGVPLMP